MKTDRVAGALLAGVTAMAAPAAAQTGDPSEEIVVTAQKREERAFDVPIAMNAFSGATLEDREVSSSIEIARLVPNLYASQTSESVNALFFMRGVGSDDFNITGEGGVGVYVDEVFIRTPHAQVFGLPDIERVEVLRGPQGSLYGRNTSGGAISFYTRRPTDEFESFARVRVGNEGRLDAEATVSGPIVEEELRARFTLQSNSRDGLVRNDIGQSPAVSPDLGSYDDYRTEENWTARGIVDIAPAPGVEIIASADFTRNSNIGNGSSHVGLGPGGLDSAGYRDADGDPFTGEYNLPAATDYDAYGASLRLIWDLGPATLHSISGARLFDLDAAEDSDASPNTLGHFFFTAREDQYSQEIRLSSDEDGRLDWLVGFYYFHENASATQGFDIPTLAPPPFGAIVFTPDQTTDAYALFGQATYHITSRWSGTLGLRGTYEEKAFRIGVEARDQFRSPLFAFPLFPEVSARDDWSNVSPRLNLAYRYSDNLNVYATVSQGFKAGGFNGAADSPVAAAESYDPEIVTAYEVGLKARNDEGVTFNTAAFYYDYRDLQVFTIRDVGGAATTFLDNAAQATIYGAEFELSISPIERLRLSANLGLLHTEYQEFILDGADLSGNSLIRAPEVSALLSAEYSIPLPGDHTLTLAADYNHLSEHFFSPENESFLREDGYSVLNAQVTFESADGRFQLMGWVKNLEDTRYIRNAGDTPAPIMLATNNYGDPRLFGLTATFRFQ
ncbi:MAG: TonB-dependent receptor [Hyphomonadaceae bacterium]|nr:TonB-dependent receptor [Hyphomonadaceae bacterium]